MSQQHIMHVPLHNSGYQPCGTINRTDMKHLSETFGTTTMWFWEEYSHMSGSRKFDHVKFYDDNSFSIYDSGIVIKSQYDEKMKRWFVDIGSISNGTTIEIRNANTYSYTFGGLFVVLDNANCCNFVYSP